MSFLFGILQAALSLFLGGDGFVMEPPAVPPPRPIELVSLEPSEKIVEGCWNRDSIPERTFLRFRDGFCMPCRAEIRSHFGVRRGRYHNGIDLPVPNGTEIYAAFGGVVRTSTYLNGYGNIVIIRHPNGMETGYAHLQKRLVNRGDRVETGDIIALSGCTGRSTGPHLHFETLFCGKHFDPESIIDFQTGALKGDGFILRREMLKK